MSALFPGIVLHCCLLPASAEPLQSADAAAPLDLYRFSAQLMLRDGAVFRRLLYCVAPAELPGVSAATSAVAAMILVTGQLHVEGIGKMSV